MLAVVGDGSPPACRHRPLRLIPYPSASPLYSAASRHPFLRSSAPPRTRVMIAGRYGRIHHRRGPGRHQPARSRHRPRRQTAPPRHRAYPVHRRPRGHMNDIVSPSHPCANNRARGLAGIGVGVPGFIRSRKAWSRDCNNSRTWKIFPCASISPAAGNARDSGKRRQRRGPGREVDRRRPRRARPGAAHAGHRHRRRHHLRRPNGPRLRRDGRRTGPHHGGSQRQSLRLRQPRLPGKTRLGHRHHRHGRLMQLWRRPHLEGGLRPGRARARTGARSPRIWR